MAHTDICLFPGLRCTTLTKDSMAINSVGLYRTNKLSMKGGH